MRILVGVQLAIGTESMNSIMSPRHIFFSLPYRCPI